MSQSMLTQTWLKRLSPPLLLLASWEMQVLLRSSEDPPCASRASTLRSFRIRAASPSDNCFFRIAPTLLSILLRWKNFKFEWTSWSFPVVHLSSMRPSPSVTNGLQHCYNSASPPTGYCNCSASLESLVFSVRFLLLIVHDHHYVDVAVAEGRGTIDVFDLKRVLSPTKLIKNVQRRWILQ